MDPLATADDVAAAWRLLAPAEDLQVTNLLEFASEIIRSQVTDVDDRIAAGTLSEVLVRHVAVQMVLRHLRNPEGLRSTSVQESIDDYSTTVTETKDQALSDGSIYLTDGELSLLKARRRGAFSVTPSQEPATPVIAERVAINQASWR